VSAYKGPGVYKHYKGGYYDIFGQALWEPMAGKDDGDTDLAANLEAIAANSERGGRDLEDNEIAMLRRAAELLSERKFVIYAPLTPGSLLEGMDDVEFWARGRKDFDTDATIPDARGIAMTVRRFTPAPWKP
jgi:hypothetical protein